MHRTFAQWTSHPSPYSSGDRVTIAEMVKKVMLNLFQHLMESITYETLKRVQGDKKWITTQSPPPPGRGALPSGGIEILRQRPLDRI